MMARGDTGLKSTFLPVFTAVGSLQLIGENRFTCEPDEISPNPDVNRSKLPPIPSRLAASKLAKLRAKTPKTRGIVARAMQTGHVDDADGRKAYVFAASKRFFTGSVAKECQQGPKRWWRHNWHADRREIICFSRLQSRPRANRYPWRL